MIQRKLGYFFGKIKLLLYKLFYPKRIKFKKIKFNKTSNIYIDKKSKVILGKNINMRKNISIWSTNGGTILIGDYAYINDNCTITDNDHDYKTSLSNFICEEVEIGDNVWCGCNVVILKGVKIGDNCVIAAGTVVNKDIPNNSMVYQERELVIKKIKK